MPSEKSIFYYAYGSNMSSGIFVHGFRKMNPSSAERAILRGYRLAFSEAGIPFFEPAFANVEEDEAALVEGVLYRITEKEMDDLHISEGGRAYNIIHVPVVGDMSGSVEAQVFQSKHPAHGLHPSKRYIDILIDGAREHGLSEAWVTMLENTSYVDRTAFLHIRKPVFTFIQWMREHGLPHPFGWWKQHHIRKTMRRKSSHVSQLRSQ